MADIRIVEVTDADAFELVPPCADPAFDHRSCDYWENAETGSKAARPSWLGRGADEGRDEGGPASAARRTSAFNPFLEEASRPKPAVNPFDPRAVAGGGGSKALPVDNPFAAPADNPFVPPPRPARGPRAGAPRKLALLQRGLGVAGTYAKVLLADGVPAAYAQFGPLSAYPRALRTRELYPRLPVAPLPAVITCISTTAEGRGRGHAATLVAAVCDDLAARGFAAVEVYPEVGARLEATSAAGPGFWERLGFVVAAPDERFPVLRRELT